MGKKLLAISLGIAVGAALVAAAWTVWDLVHPRPHRLDAAERKQLQQKLDENPTAIFMYDESTSFRYKPNFHGYRVRPHHLGARDRVNFAHVTNSLGLIGPDEISGDPRLPKVLVLGDSVTYGVWMDGKDTFPVRMQQIAGASCQVMVGACEGWSTKQEIAFFDAYLRGVDWRVVVLAFCLNDLVDFEWAYDTGNGAKLTEEILSVGNGGTRTNQTIGGLKLALLRHTFAADPKTAALANQTNTALWAWEDDRWNHYLESTLAPFVDRSDRPPLVIAMLPTEGQLKSLALGADPSRVLHPQVRLQRFCQQKNLACIDLSDAFAEAAPDEIPKQFLDDLHFAEDGHAALARYLWPRLEPFVKRPATRP